jgi:hypothetical protein
MQDEQSLSALVNIYSNTPNANAFDKVEEALANAFAPQLALA